MIAYTINLLNAEVTFLAFNQTLKHFFYKTQLLITQSTFILLCFAHV